MKSAYFHTLILSSILIEKVIKVRPESYQVLFLKQRIGNASDIQRFHCDDHHYLALHVQWRTQNGGVDGFAADHFPSAGVGDYHRGDYEEHGRIVCRYMAVDEHGGKGW